MFHNTLKATYKGISRTKIGSMALFDGMSRNNSFATSLIFCARLRIRKTGLKPEGKA
jgi:hypothetical protein